MKRALPSMTVRAAAWLLVGAMAAQAAAAETPNLVINSDFETATADRPPPGWTMWGAQPYKDPAHFTRDTANPHGGEACFRIHHPADTAGYVVTTPQHPIRTRRGGCIRDSFWARAAHEGTALFGLDAYTSIRPYRGAPSPGFYPIPVNRQWTRHTFEVHEGWDFFADKTPLVLLVLKATAERGEAQTLWIDDVVATQAPSPREGRLLDPSGLEVPPIAHRLARGKHLAFTVDPRRRLGRATRRACGISFHRVAGWAGVPFDKQGRYVLAPQLEEAVRDLRLPMTRFYAVGDEPFGLEAAIDKAAAMCRLAGIPREHVVLEFEIQGATKRLPPEAWARGVRHARAKGYPFHYWEITNEPYVQRAKANFPTAEDYLAHFLAVAKAVREAHPDGQVGLPIHPRSHPWGNYLLKRAAGHYDFVVGHYYHHAPAHDLSFEEVVLRGNWEVLRQALTVGALIRAYNPDRAVYQLDTEWGLHSPSPSGKRAGHVARNGNIVGTMHRAVRMIYYVREGYLRGASSWEMFTRRSAPGFCVLTPDAPDKRTMLYWLYYYTNRHVGEWALATDGTAPYWEWSDGDARRAVPQTPVLATASADGRTIFLVIANGSWTRPAPCRVALEGFSPKRAVGVALSHDDPEAGAVLDHKEAFVHDLTVRAEGGEVTFTVPPHAVVFVTLEASDG